MLASNDASAEHWVECLIQPVDLYYKLTPFTFHQVHSHVFYAPVAYAVDGVKSHHGKTWTSQGSVSAEKRTVGKINSHMKVLIVGNVSHMRLC